jgi:hypothetical protein
MSEEDRKVVFGILEVLEEYDAFDDYYLSEDEKEEMLAALAYAVRKARG